jgi:hypothetical protein
MMSGAVAVISPPGAPYLTAQQLVASPVLSTFFAVAAGDLDSFLRDHRVRAYLSAGVYVIVKFADASDAIGCERRIAVQRGTVR